MGWVSLAILHSHAFSSSNAVFQKKKHGRNQQPHTRPQMGSERQSSPGPSARKLQSPGNPRLSLRPSPIPPLASRAGRRHLAVSSTTDSARTSLRFPGLPPCTSPALRKARAAAEAASCVFYSPRRRRAPSRRCGLLTLLCFGRHGGALLRTGCWVPALTAAARRSGRLARNGDHLLEPKRREPALTRAASLPLL